MKKISVIMATFNEEKNIEACLRSIVEQNYPSGHIEILISDGGSTDGTLTAINHFRTRWPVEIKIFKNDKVIAEFGKAISINHARGEILLFLDADERLVQRDFLKEMLKPFAEEIPDLLGVKPYMLPARDMSALCIYLTHLLNIADPVANFVSARPRWLRAYPSFNLYRIREPYPCGANGFMIRKDILEKIGWAEQYNESLITAKGIRMGWDKIARKTGWGIYHYYTPDWKTFFKKKLKRAYKHMTRITKERETSWLASRKPHLALACLYFLSFLFPLLVSWGFFLRTKNKIWLLHAPVGLATAVIYIYGYVSFFFKKKMQW